MPATWTTYQGRELHEEMPFLTILILINVVCSLCYVFEPKVAASLASHLQKWAEELPLALHHLSKAAATHLSPAM